MGSLESLKTIADYRESPTGGYLSKSTFGIGTSRALALVKNKQKEDVIAVAPRSFFGDLLSWVMPSKVDIRIQSTLKKMIQESLIKVGINESDSQEIIKQVVGNNQGRSMTREDLRAIIKKAENIIGGDAQSGVRGFSLKPIDRTSREISVRIEDPLQSKIAAPEEGAISAEESFSDVDLGAETEAAALIHDAKPSLKKMTFDSKEVFALRERVEQQKNNIKKFLDGSSLDRTLNTLNQPEEKLGVSVAPEKKEKITLRPRTRIQLEEQRDHLIVKEKMLSQYLENDPFSDKNVLYPRRIYAEAAKLTIEDQLLKDRDQMPILPSTLKEKFDGWYQAEVDSYEKADSTKRSQEPDFYLNKINPENPLVKFKAKYVVDELKKLFVETDFPVDKISEQEIDQAAATAMNTVLDWKAVKRDMIFSIGEKTGSYSQVSTPLSESETAVGADLREKRIGGIIPSVRDDGRAPTNARLTQLFKMKYVVNSNTGEREETKVLLHERQQHGINDHFAIQDHRMRHQANLSSMKQLVQSGAEADSDFIQDAIEHPEQLHCLFYINTNLTTPTWTPRGNKNNEEAYSRHQGAAMRAVEEIQTFSVLNPNDPGKRVDAKLSVTCIDFRFPVNYAISSFSEDKRSIDPGMIPAWPALKTHNEREFKKLFGSLDAEAPIKGIMGLTYQKLEEKVPHENEDDFKLKTEIDRQVKYVRNMFSTEAYKTAGEDRFKMPRHIDLLVNAFRQASELVDNHQVRVVNAGGCMSGKDREGVANAENEAAVIIQDLGGNVEPGKGGRYDDGTRAIYDTCVTGVVHNTRQVTGIGGSKNAQEIESQMRDSYAKIYAQGGAKFVSA